MYRKTIVLMLALTMMPAASAILEEPPDLEDVLDYTAKCQDPLAGGGNVVNTNAVCFPFRALQTPILERTNLVKVGGVWNDEVFYGDKWTVGFRIDIDPEIMVPVDVTVSPPTIELKGQGTGCNSAETDVREGSGAAAGSNEETKFRLYPHTYANLLDEAGVGLNSHIVVLLKGMAPYAPGMQFDPLHCLISSIVVASSVTAPEVVTSVLNTVTAFPPPVDALPIGDFVGIENGQNGATTATPSVPAAIPMFGSQPTWDLYASVKATFQQTEDEFHDSDYMTVDWTPGTTHILERLGSHTVDSGTITLQDGQVTLVCATANVYDHEYWSWRADRGGTSASICVELSYFQVDASAIFTPPACENVANAVLAGRAPDVASVTDCSALDLELGWDLDSVHEFINGDGTFLPAIVDGVAGFAPVSLV